MHSPAEPPVSPKSVLTADCGHHCGKKDNMIGHCPCQECHDVARIRSLPRSLFRSGLEEENQ